ncbi:hypothetical protein CLV35_3850 [Motilibacter peucedani]|uniref:Uncharacterized protein n=1 Tax=Motilibacter peucedani TaxID=598650 RepID=A0A420XJP0_9ACTN|nr:hypothetical protein [Motilibacter peucedani]RKS67944.1 hypothetical protein CLV35_3850 [Motilibacter peucedani]
MSEGLLGDAWSAALLAPGGTPGRAAAAGPPPPDGVRAAALACWLLSRAARDGSTWLPAEVLVRALGALEVGDPAAGLRGALDAGAVALLDDGVLALPGLALLEQDAAEEVERLLVTEGSVRVVVGPRGEARDAAVAALPGEPDLVLDDAERLDLASFAEQLAEVPEGGSVVVAGDPDLPAATPGAVLRDLAASASLEVVRVDAPPADASALEQLRAAVRAGVLPPPEALATPERSVVVVPVDTDERAAARAAQLMEASIPRAFGVAAGEVLVLSPLVRGAAGVRALGAATPARVEPAAGWGEDAEAVVLVLPPSAAGAVRRDLVLGALHRARRHVSLVTGLGAALPAAVALPARPRRTRLGRLLEE